MAPPRPAATRPAPKGAPPTGPHRPVVRSTGDRVFVLFWRPAKMPDGRDAGGWETAVASVIGVGPAAVCVLLDNPGLPFVGAGTEPAGSAVRFVAPDTVFTTHEDAVSAAETKTPPG